MNVLLSQAEENEFNRESILSTVGTSSSEGDSSISTEDNLKGDINAVNDYGRTLLYWYAWHGNIDAVNCCISVGADPNIKDWAGWTPLHCAVHKSDDVIVSALVAHEADIHIKSCKVYESCAAGWSPMTLAMASRNDAIIGALEVMTNTVLVQRASENVFNRYWNYSSDIDFNSSDDMKRTALH